MSDTDFNPIKALREALVPKGTANLVKLEYSAFVDADTVTKLIDELVMKTTMVAVGMDEISTTDKLLFEVLTQSAGIKIKEPTNETD